jgi:hypothetical protein
VTKLADRREEDQFKRVTEIIDAAVRYVGWCGA